jgi:hypothetical protein
MKITQKQKEALVKRANEFRYKSNAILNALIDKCEERLRDYRKITFTIKFSIDHFYFGEIV